MSLEENLVMGEKGDGGHLKECVQMADLETKLRKLPEGLSTMFGLGSYEGAVDFSGGELQKLMLARALYKRAPLLVLDEPTAALDPLMESELYESYRHFSEGRTTVFISHRLAGCHFCDRILVFEEGRIVEQGSHEALLETKGLYRKLWDAQAKYYA